MTRLISILALLVLSAYYFANVVAIIWESVRRTGGFDFLETVLLLWAVVPWTLLAIGLSPRQKRSDSE